MDPEEAAVLVAGIAAIASIASAWVSSRNSRRIDETHRQLTENSHKSNPPTILDEIHTLRADVEIVKTNVEHHDQIQAARYAFLAERVDTFVKWGAAEKLRIWEAIHELRRRFHRRTAQRKEEQ